MPIQVRGASWQERRIIAQEWLESRKNSHIREMRVLPVEEDSETETAPRLVKPACLPLTRRVKPANTTLQRSLFE